MIQEVHPTPDNLEGYATGRLTEPESVRVEEHLLICEQCQNELALTDRYVQAVKNVLSGMGAMVRRLRSVHITEDGPIFGAMHGTEDGKWVARHWGSQL